MPAWALLLAALFKGLFDSLFGAAKVARDDQAKVDQGRAEVRAEVQTIVTETADAQATVNQVHRSSRAVAERLLREAGVEPGGAEPNPPGPHA